MTGTISGALLGYVVVAPVVAVTVHILAARRLRRAGRLFSPQAHLVKLLLLLNLPLLGGVLFLGGVEGRSASEMLLMSIFAFIVFNGTGYAYFHVFNMSETARRIRMLLSIRDHGSLHSGELAAEYSPEHMVRARLARLIEMGQVVRDADGRYRIKSHFLVWAAGLVRFFRNILRLPSSERPGPAPVPRR
jgi:hypothetical protein